MSKPTESEISQTIRLLQKRLAHPEIDKPVNKPIKEGYEEAVRILVEDVTSYVRISNLLATQQGRAIAVLAVDYLLGEYNQKLLTSIPLKK